MLLVLAVLGSCLGVGYSIILLRYLYYWHQIPISEILTNFVPTTTVSIVIAARDEEKSIEKCLKSILNQSYPSDLMEVIVVDDHSDDNTIELIEPYAAIVGHSLEEGKEGKKEAIKAGIAIASGKLIVTTDADCTMNQNWLTHIVHLYEQQKPKMIAAPVIFEQEKTGFEHFQSLDFMGMMGVSAAGVEGGFMQMCNGANLAYEKAAFEAVNGFEGIDHLASGDDMLLMEKIVRKYPNGLAYLKQPAAVTKTTAKPTISAFLQQRLRWATKSGNYQSWQTQLILATVWGLCWMLLVSLGLGLLIDTNYLYLFGILFLVKAFWDYLFLGTMSRFFGKEAQMQFFLPSLFWHWWYIVVVGTWSLVRKQYEWKGRKTR